MLEVRKNKFAKPYENEFFRILARKLSVVFEDLKINGVLIGSPLCKSTANLQLDALLISETAIAIIDFKKYEGNLKLPAHSAKWLSKNEDPSYKQPWIINGKEVKGGSHKNPFAQMEWQANKLSQILENTVKPKLLKEENIETKDTKKIVCFQRPITLRGEVDPRFSHGFFIADPNSIVNCVSDIIHVSPNEWMDKISGNKLSQNAFDQIKKIFLADSFNPFIENHLFEDFANIEYSENEFANRPEIVEAEFEQNKEVINQFISTDIPVLIVNSDITAYRIELIEKITYSYLKDRLVGEEEESIESKVCYLAPNSRNVSDLIRIGAPINTHSLYGKLYDFENSIIELLSNSVNEKEVFPLLKNKEANGMLYVIFNSHMIYNFGTGENELIKFGSGSLCNDTLTYLDLKNRKNKVILVTDPYFYGHRAETLADASNLIANTLDFLRIDLTPRSKEPNQKNIADLIKNINQSTFNNFSFKQNENVSFLFDTSFKAKLIDSIKNNRINGITILTREKNEISGINNWIRRTKGISEKAIQTGDLLFVKNRAIVPEEIDPFSIPKFVISGDIGEVIEICERYSFTSVKYTLNKIEVSKCKVQLRDYDAIKILYVSNSSIQDILDFKELKQHIQIRSRELVDDYHKTHQIQLKDILQPNELEEYINQKANITNQNGLFDSATITLKSEELEKQFKKLDAKWKINKRKERFVKNELMKNIDSEFFKITQMVHFEFAWALCLKSCYGYQMTNSFLLEYTSPLKNIIRFHKYLYSALGCTDNLTIHNFNGISPWFDLDTEINMEDIPNNMGKKEILCRLETNLPDEFDRFLIEKYNLNDVDPKLIFFCRWVTKILKDQPQIQLQRIDHVKYQERYIFSEENMTATIIFFYNDKGEVRFPQKTNENELSSKLVELLSMTEKESYSFLSKENWRKIELDKLQTKLISKGTFIYELNSSEWKEELKISSDMGDCHFSLTYNKSGFFTSIKFISKTSDEPVYILLNAIKEMKNNQD